MFPSEKLLKMADICEYLGVTDAAIYKWMKDAGFPEPIRLGAGGKRSALRWKPEELNRWLSSRPKGTQG